MSDHDPNSITQRDTSPLLRFTTAMGWPRERPHAEMPDEDGLGTDDAPAERRLGEIEARIDRLAERFDQLEFLIVEQFEPGMTEAGELPAGNLRDRLDRIEAGLDLLRREAPDAATWTDAMASHDEVPDTTVFESRLDEIVARLADLADIAAGPDGAADGFGARLQGFEQRIEVVADDPIARHDGVPSATVADDTARETPLAAMIEAAVSRQADLTATISAEMEAQHAAILAALDRAISRQPAGHTQEHSSFAGFATALQTTLSQFEVSVDSILDRLDGLAKRLEVAEARIAAPADPDEAVPAGVWGLETSLGVLSEGIGALAAVISRQTASAPDAGTSPAVLDHLGTLVTAAVGAAARDNRAAIEETLHDLRLAVAEIAADRARLRIA
jgi:hypothetical protein